MTLLNQPRSLLRISMCRLTAFTWVSALMVVLPSASRCDELGDYLELINITTASLDDFAAPPTVDEQSDTLLTILLRAPAFPLAKLHHWQLRGAAWEECFGSMESARGQFYQLRGRVGSVTRIQLDAATHQRYLLENYYRVNAKLDGTPAASATIYARSVPSDWFANTDTGEIDERFSAIGLLLRSVKSDDASSSLVLAADRVAWHPDDQEPAIPVPADWRELGRLGVDMGQFDQLRDEQSITARDRELFYQLLAAAKQYDPARDESVDRSRQLECLLTDPTGHRGERFSLSGAARRAIRVQVDEEDILARYEIDHYYEITMLMDPGPLIRVMKGDDDTEGIVFTNYPVTFCVLHLPVGLPTGDYINEPVRIDGWFLKLWSYKNEFMNRGDNRETDAPALQVSPLLIGYRIQHEATGLQATTSSVSGVTVGALFVAALGLLAALFVWFNRDDRKLAIRKRAKRDESAETSLGMLTADDE